jgi:hypothetical protein
MTGESSTIGRNDPSDGRIAIQAGTLTDEAVSVGRKANPVGTGISFETGTMGR